MKSSFACQKVGTAGFQECTHSFSARAFCSGESLGEREGEQFLGMFSFRFEDETYQSDKERAATKETANYVVELSPNADSGNMRLVSLQKRLHARNKALEWKDESQELRNAA